MALTKIDGGKNIEIGLAIGGKPSLSVMAAESTFASGSRGFQVPAKVVIDGKTYQCNLQLVEVGSKPAAVTAVNSKR